MEPPILKLYTYNHSVFVSLLSRHTHTYINIKEKDRDRRVEQLKLKEIRSSRLSSKGITSGEKSQITTEK